jgi:endonuclease III
MAAIVGDHNGTVPRTMEQLLALRGVARKTANVVLGNAFGINDGFVVDTHIERLARRFCLCPPGATVAAVERHLMALFPQERWCTLSHQFIWHGRAACKARGKGCADHPICREFGGCCERRQSQPAPATPRRNTCEGDTGPARRNQTR